MSLNSSSPASGHVLDAVTVLRTIDRKPYNKVITRLPNGEVIKAMAPNSGRFAARTVPCPDLAALADVVREVVERPDALLSLSVFPRCADRAPPDEFVILPMAVLAQALGCAEHDRAALAGFHDFGGEVPVCARMLENAAHSSFLLIDRDLPDGIPDALRDLDDGEFDAALDLLLPGFVMCGKVCVPSTSGRLVVDGEPPKLRGGHKIVRVADPALIDAKWPQAMLRSLITGYERTPWENRVPLAFAKPVRERKNGTGQILRHDWWPIVDRSTEHRGRLVFEGKPDVRCQGVKVAQSIVRAVDGPSLDLAKVRDLSRDELGAAVEAIRKIKGVKPRISLKRQPGARGRSPVVSVAITVADLEWDTELETEGGWKTVRELHQAGAGHTRCQSPFRDSYSWAAYYNIHGDGSPFVFDSGTSEKYTLRRDRNPTMCELLYEWLVEHYEPSRANAVGDAFYSETRKTWIRQSEIKVPNEILPRLAEGRDAPEDKDGSVKMYAVATQARTWLGFAFGDLIPALPQDDDDDAPTAARAAAAAEFKQQLAALLKYMVYGEGADCAAWAGSKRALGTWIHWVTLNAPGSDKRRRFGSYDAIGIIDPDGFRIAMRPSLAGQVSKTAHPEIAAMTESKFSKRCAKASIRFDARDNIFEEGKRERWTVLSPEFIASLDLAIDHTDTPGEASRRSAEAMQRACKEHGSSAGKGYFGDGGTKAH
jgi:hypothetical protein